MRMEIKDSGIYIDMTHDAREYKNRILALNGITPDAQGNEFVDAWADVMADAMHTLDNMTDEEIYEMERQIFDPSDFHPDCPICQMMEKEIEDEIVQMAKHYGEE